MTSNTKSLLVSVPQIGDDGVSFSLSFDSNELNGIIRDRKSELQSGAKGLSGHLLVTKSFANILVHGEIDVDLKYRCCRCLGEISRQSHISISWRFFPASILKDREEGEILELEEEDLEVSFYRDDEINVEEVLREVVLLELDPYPICSDEHACKETYKAMLPEKDERETLDPRWLPLLKLKKERK